MEEQRLTFCRRNVCYGVGVVWLLVPIIWARSRNERDVRGGKEKKKTNSTRERLCWLPFFYLKWLGSVRLWNSIEFPTLMLCEIDKR